MIKDSEHLIELQLMYTKQMVLKCFKAKLKSMQSESDITNAK